VLRCFAAVKQLPHLRRYVANYMLSHVIGAFYAGLRQLHTCRSSCLSPTTPPGRSQRCSFDFVGWTTWPMSSRYYTGYVSRSGWISNLRWWHIVFSMTYQTCQVAAVFGRHLHSSCSFRHMVSVRLTTIGRRWFPVATAIVWNTLPVHVQSSPSISTFCQRLKTFLFQQPFSDIIIWHY